MKPGDRIDAYTVGAAQPDAGELSVFAAGPEHEIGELKAHARLRAGAVDHFLAWRSPAHPAFLPELRRLVVDGAPVVVRAASRPARKDELDPVPTLAWLTPAIALAPGAGPEDLRVDADGIVRLAPTGLPPAPMAPTARTRIAEWLGAPAGTPASDVPARVRPATVAPPAAPVPRFVLWMSEVPPTVTAAVATLSGVPEDRVAEAARRREGWAVEAAVSVQDATRRAAWLGRRGVPVEIVPLGVSAPSYLPALLVSALGQAAFLLDGTAQTLGVVVGTALGAGLLVRSLRGLRPWSRSRSAQQAWRRTEAARVDGPARTAAALLAALPAAQLPDLAHQALRDALEEAQDAMLDGASVDPAALARLPQAMAEPTALAPVVGELSRALRHVRQKAAPLR